ncbi:MAG TPA: chemotaxis protein [Bacillales bacterium]|nr:chemotaxis protein [Bacillales bacterium]
MTRKLAIAVVHGIGSQKENFADAMIGAIRNRFSDLVKNQCSDPATQLVFKPVYWAGVFEKEERELWRRLEQSGDMNYKRLRLFVVNYLADAIAYQPTAERRHNYDNVHQVVAESLQELSEEAGGDAPLCIIAHSLGSVIVSNYFYDLQYEPEKIRPMVRASQRKSALARGETLAQLYTLGSSLPLWCLRFQDFGNAIYVPAPKFALHCPDIETGWWNYYDKDDILGYPLKALNEHYERAVTEDVQVNAGGWLTSWNPFSHLEYANDQSILHPIAERLASTWRQLNE